MSPSPGRSQRLTTVVTSRWFIAIMIPLPGTTVTPGQPGHVGDLARPDPAGVDHEGGLDAHLAAAAVVAAPPRPTTRSPSRRISVTQW